MLSQVQLTPAIRLSSLGQIRGGVYNDQSIQGIASGLLLCAPEYRSCYQQSPKVILITLSGSKGEDAFGQGQGGCWAHATQICLSPVSASSFEGSLDHGVALIDHQLTFGKYLVNPQVLIEDDQIRICALLDSPLVIGKAKAIGRIAGDQPESIG